MNFWKSLLEELEENRQVVMMYVIQSNGSSPGRQGFKMWVSSSYRLDGSIGGGIMEHKLVEYCREDLVQKEFNPFLKNQIHQHNIKANKSGMICSGDQNIAFYKITADQLDIVSDIVTAIEEKEYGVLKLYSHGIAFIKGQENKAKFQLSIKDEFTWFLEEDLGFKPEMYVVGGGHVGLALSQVAHYIGFKIYILDDRLNLNTVTRNIHAKFVYVHNYENIAESIPSGENKYIVIMSFGYRTDKAIIKSIIHKNYKYLGMMGSKKKVDVLFDELKAEGVPSELINKVYSPIGIPIKSQTPHEIAISILAEIISVKNADK